MKNFSAVLIGDDGDELGTKFTKNVYFPSKLIIKRKLKTLTQSHFKGDNKI